MSSQTIDITTQRLTLTMDMKIGEEPSTDPSPVTQAQCKCGAVPRAISRASPTILCVAPAIFEKTNGGSSSISTIRIKPTSSSMKMLKGTRGKLFTSAR